jgi:hypothetical protein
VSADPTGTAAEWVVLVYMAANNELAADAENCFRAIKAVSPSDAVSVAVQMRTPGPVTTRYYRRGACTDTTDLRPSPNMGEEKTLTDFVDWGLGVCPARKSLLVVWGHGKGIEDSSPRRSIGMDDGEAIDNQAFRQAIAGSAAQRVDVLGCDACLMSTIEVAFEMHEVASVMVASETKAPRQSWPYEPILTALAARSSMTPTELARAIVEVFKAWYVDPTHANDLKYASLAAVDLRATAESAAAFKSLADALTTQIPAAPDDLRQARDSTPGLEIPDYIDLESFLEQIAGDLPAPQVSAAVQGVQSAFAAALIDACSVGDEARGTSGLSLYFPTLENAASFPEYRDLAFAAATGWPVFLDAYFGALRGRAMGGRRGYPPPDHPGARSLRAAPDPAGDGTRGGGRRGPSRAAEPPDTRRSSPARRGGPATILFLAANPSSTTRLALDRESREIDQRLRGADLRDAFRIEQAWAVRGEDLQERLLRHRPAIAHFSGHGSPAGELVLEDPSGAARPVGKAALASLFRILHGGVRCVVLNACFSERQALAIAEHVDCVVGMTTAVEDSSAIAFAGAFYQALGYGESVKVAFDLGANQIDIAGLAEADVPRLVCRSGVDASAVFIFPR